MQHFTTTLALTALLTASSALAGDDNVPPIEQPTYQLEKAPLLKGVGSDSERRPTIIIDEWRDQGPKWSAESQSLDEYKAAGASSKKVIDHGYTYTVEKTDDQSGIGVRSPEVGLPDDPTKKVTWEKFEGVFNAVGDEMVRAARNGATLETHPFEDRVARWRVQLGPRTSFYDLGEVFPVLEQERQARDLWARALDASVLGRLDALRAAAARGESTAPHFDGLRAAVALRTEVLGDDAARRGEQGLAQRLAEAQAAGPDQGELMSFELEFINLRLHRAIGMMNLRRHVDGGVELSDRLRITELVGRFQRIKAGEMGLDQTPVR